MPQPDTLDDEASYALDRDGMFGHIRTVGAQLVAAWEQSAAAPLPWTPEEITGVAIAGIGGSATAGDYFAVAAAASSPIPVVVVQGYDLPAWVGPSTLVVACSYSGNTPETLSAYEAARNRGARLAAITGGGALAEAAAAGGIPIFRIGYRASPRATTVHTLAPLLRVGLELQLLQVADGGIAAVAAAHSGLVERELAPSVPRAANAAKAIAHDIAGRTAIVLGAGHLEPAAVRFKNQLAENGKSLAAADFIPQAGHNLVVGLATASRRPDDYVVVALGSRLLTRATAARGAAVAHEFEAAGIRVHGVLVDGGSFLGDIIQATAWGDYVSCYLALLNGEDPTPVPQIDRVRAYGS